MPNYNVLMPDVRPIENPLSSYRPIDGAQLVSGFRAGEQDGRVQAQQAMKQAAGAKMAAGDWKGGAQTLYAGGDLDTGMKIDQAAVARERQEFERNFGALASATTPQAWSQTVGAIRASGKELPAGMENFQNRSFVMSKLFSAKELMDQHFKTVDDKRADAQLGLQQQAAGREAELFPVKKELMQAQAAQARQKDELNGAIAGMIKGSLPQPPQAEPQSPIRPQSFDGGGGGEPQLIPAQVSAPAAPAQAQGQMVDTPMGPMPVDQARRAAMALALGGKADAGKMLMESVNAGQLGKEGQNELDKKMIAVSDNVANLSAISARFKPEFMQLQNRAGLALDEMADKVGKLDPGKKAKLAEFAAFRADAVDALNQYIKSVTGAAMTEAEAKRLMAAFPTAGDGIFNGDSPTAFKAKLDAALLKAKMAAARYTYARQNGKNWQTIGLEQFSSSVFKEGKQLESDLLKKGISEREADGMVRQELKRKYGIDL